MYLINLQMDSSNSWILCKFVNVADGVKGEYAESGLSGRLLSRIISRL